MNILIVSPYYNNSHFISTQIKSFKKYLKNCSWKLLILDDSTDSTKNVLTKENENIENECLKYDNCLYHRIPQDIHNDIKNGPARHRNVLNYMIKIIAPIYKKEFDFLASFDADMCLIRDFDALKELSSYDIISPKRIQWLGHIQISDNFPVFDYIWVHLCFFNLKTITNIENIKMDAIPNTTADTGSMIIEFLYNNPNYKIKYLDFQCGCERISELYDLEFFYKNTFCHFITSSNWSNANSSKYYEDYSDKFNYFNKLIDNGLSVEEEKKIEKEIIEKWNIIRNKFTGRHVTKNDLIKYGLNIY